MTTASQKITAEELLRMPDDGFRGEVYAAETGFQLASNPDTVRAPDVAFVSRQRLEEAGPVRGYWPGAPDLAVEVISPSATYTEVQDKVLTPISPS